MTDDQAPLLDSGDEITSVVVAVDSTNGSGRVLSTATRLSRAAPAAKVHVVHVFATSRFERSRAGAPAPNADFVEEAKEHLAAHVRTAQRQCRNEVSGHFVVGEPVTEILRFSETFAASLLVIGTHDHKGFERLLLGSVAETLVRKAHCSVLVVRARSYT